MSEKLDFVKKLLLAVIFPIWQREWQGTGLRSYQFLKLPEVFRISYQMIILFSVNVIGEEFVGISKCYYSKKVCYVT